MTTVPIQTKRPKKPPKIHLKTINPHITCNLCKGYLIDATTIVECLHSFCHSCIMRHLRKETYCPSCEMLINKAKPNIKPDATLQAIVYKLVPGLYEKELLRRRAFYKLRPDEAKLATPEQRGDDTEHLIFGPTENLSLMLEHSEVEDVDENINLRRSIVSGKTDTNTNKSDDSIVSILKTPKYLQCPAIFTIGLLKKFILSKFEIDSNKFFVEVMYKVKTIALPDHYTLMDVAYIYTWKRDAPMKFFFCVRAVEYPPEDLEEAAQKAENPTDISLNGTSEHISALAEMTVIPSAPIAIQVQLPEATTAESATSVKPNIPIGSPMTTSIISNLNDKSCAAIPAADTAPLDAVMTKVEDNNKADNEHVVPCDQIAIKCDTDLNVKVAEEPRVENIKIKIDHSKQRKVSIVKSKRQDGDREINNAPVKKSDPVKELKVRLKKEPKQSRETKVQGKNLKSRGKVGAENETKQKPSMPKEAKSASILNIKAESNQLSSRAEHIGKEQKEPVPEKVCTDSDVKVEPEGEEVDEKKSEFLNSFHLTPTKSLSPEKPSVEGERGDDAKSEKSPPQEKVNAMKGQQRNVNLLPTKPVNQKKERAQNGKGSKRKSREPIKNITKKSRSESPCLQRIHAAILKPIKSKTPPLLPKDAPTISFALAPFPIGTSATKPVLSPTSSPVGISLPTKCISPLLQIAPKPTEPGIAQSAVQSKPPPLKILDFWSPKEPVEKSDVVIGTQLSGPESKSVYNGPFKVPTLPVKDSPVKKSVRQTGGPTKKAANARKPVVVNNVQRPKQADTPRPTLKARGTTTKLTPILPKIAPAAPKPNLIAPMGSVRLGSGTEIKEIGNDSGRKNFKVYGPSPDMPYGSCSPAYVPSYPSPSILNYALMNSGAPISSRPDLHFGSFYPAKTPVYAPISPIPPNASKAPTNPLQSAPNPATNNSNKLDNKYARSLLCTTSSANMTAPKPSSPIALAAAKVDVKSAANNSVSKPSSNITKTVESSKKINDATKPASPEKTPFKRTLAEAIESVTKPGDNEQKVQSLLNSCNINFPSSLSITLTNEENDPTSKNPLYNPKHKSPVNNYIEIVKLPDIPAEETNKTSRGTTTSPRPVNGIQVTTEKCKSADIKAIVNELNNKASEAKRQSVSPPFITNGNKVGSGSPPPSLAKLSTAKTPALPNSISISEITVNSSSKKSPPPLRLSPTKGTMIKTSVSPTFKTPVQSPIKTPVSPPIITNKIPAETFQAKFLQSILEKQENEMKTVKKVSSPSQTQPNANLQSASSVPKVGRPRKSSNSPSEGAPAKKKERKSTSENKPIKTTAKSSKQSSALDLSVSMMPALSPFSTPTSSKQLQTLANNNDLPPDMTSSINMSAALFMDAVARVSPSMMMPSFIPGLNQSAATLWVHQQLLMRKASHEAFVQSLKNKKQNGDSA